MLKRFLSWGALAISIVLLLSIATQSGSYKACQVDHEKSYGKLELPLIFEVAETFVVCEGVAGDANGDLLTALATIAVAAFTLTLWLTSKEQGRLTQQSIDLARAEFVASHRPVIKVRGFRWDGDDLSGDSEHAVQFEYINVGGSAAVVKEIGAVLAFTAKPDASSKPPEVPKFSILKIEPPISLQSGERELGATDTFPWDSNELRLARDRAGYIYCIGYIVYSDANQVERRTGFCRRFNFPTVRWEIADDDEYEYQD